MLKQAYEFSSRNGRNKFSISMGNDVASMGIEVGSLETFFSLENPRLGNITLPDGIAFNDRNVGWNIRIRPIFPEAQLSISELGRISELDGSRHIHVCADQDVPLMDSVLRFTFEKSMVASAHLGDEEITHISANRYHQRASRNVRIAFTSGRILVFSPVHGHLPEGMANMTYLRDERGRWVLHFRALATQPSDYLLKGCHRFWNKKLPSPLQKLALANRDVAQSLLYMRERISQRIPFQLNGAVKLVKGDSLDFGVNWRWAENG